MTTALEGGEESASRPGRSLPPGKIRYPLYRRLGGPQGRSGQVRKISPPPGFDPRTVQPVASRYAVCVTRSTLYRCPTHHRTRHFFNNSNTNEDIATKFEQQYFHCMRNEEECVCSVCLFRCNIFIGVRIIKEMPGSVACGTPCIIHTRCKFQSNTTVHYTSVWDPKMRWICSLEDLMTTQ